MITIIEPMKFDSCMSCGRTTSHLLRSFDVGPKENIRTNITFCTDCLSEMVRQEMLYQPKDEK